MLATDDAQGFGLWCSGVVLARFQQYRDRVSATVKELGKLDARRTALLEDEFLLAAAGKPVKLGDEITHRASALAIILIAGDMCREVARALFDRVPVSAGRIAGTPLAPAAIGSRTVAMRYAGGRQAAIFTNRPQLHSVQS